MSRVTMIILDLNSPYDNLNSSDIHQADTSFFILILYAQTQEFFILSWILTQIFYCFRKPYI